MGQAFSKDVDAGKDGKAVPRPAQPSGLFGLDTLNALLAEQIEPAEAAPPRDGPATIEAWLAREGLQDVAADELHAEARTTAAPRDGPATIEAWLVSEGLEEIAADEPAEALPDLAASAASLAAVAADLDPDTVAALRAWDEEGRSEIYQHQPSPVADPATARETARRRTLLGTVDRLTAMPGVGRTSRSA